MCGIGLILSGTACRGDCFASVSSDSSTSSKVAFEAAEIVCPKVRDLVGALKRRGPDSVGGARLLLSPLGQEVEHCIYPEAGDTVGWRCRNAHGSECEARCDAREEDETRQQHLKSEWDDASAQSEMHGSPNTFKFQFIGATLQLRGIGRVTQPVEDFQGNVLVYNGEIFGGLSLHENENDTKILMGCLESCCNCTCHGTKWMTNCKCLDLKDHHTIPQVLSKLRGPWALIYWQAVSRTLWFGRDAIGRRSLLIHWPSREDPRLLLTSVAPDTSEGIIARLKYWDELECGIHSLGFSANRVFESDNRLPSTSGLFSEGVVTENVVFGDSETGLVSSAMVHSWQDPLLPVMLDWKRQQVLPIINCPTCRPDDLQASYSDCDLMGVSTQRQEIRSSSLGCSDCRSDVQFGFAPSHPNWGGPRADGRGPSVEQLLAALRQSVKKRTIHITRHLGCSDVITSDIESTALCNTSEKTAPVAVLFSGGLDSMILAGLTHEFVDPASCIDLLNVSFDGHLAPDRITAVDGVAELRQVFPSRRWRLIEVDSEPSDLECHRVHLQKLICPSNTYMAQQTFVSVQVGPLAVNLMLVLLKDLNIGTALWLAASGEGHVREASSVEEAAAPVGQRRNADHLLTRHPEASSEAQVITSGINRKGYVRSEARVLLVGSGADEQCGGYGRHRTKFRLGGWSSLQEEMRLDFQRIWKRNLGRDDRCIADRGKEARFPYLDEDVIALLLSFPLWDVVDLREPPGVGDKKILRQVAQHLGLARAATAPKRAIQFGSRIARESNRTKFGSNRAANQASAGSALLAIECQNSTREKS